MHAVAKVMPEEKVCQPQWYALSDHLCHPHPSQFKAFFDVQDYRQGANDGNDALIPNALSLWLHIPDQQNPRLQGVQAMKGVQDEHWADASHPYKRMEAYLDLLYQEIALHSLYYDSDRLVKQIYLADEGAAALSTLQIKELLRTVAQYFHLDIVAGIEVCLMMRWEALSRLQPEQLLESGINHLHVMTGDSAITPQATHLFAQRRQQNATAHATLNELKKSIRMTFDCSHLFTKQAPEDILEHINLLASHQPDYLILKRPEIEASDRPTASQQHNNVNILSDMDAVLSPLLLSALQLLSLQGYSYIGPYHLALADTPLAHKIRQKELCYSLWGYSPYTDCDIVGMGLCALSHLGSYYSQNYCLLTAYQQAVLQKNIPVMAGVNLDVDQQVRLKIIENILCRRSVSFDELSQDYDFDCYQYFARELNNLTVFLENNFLEINSHHLRVHESGLFFLEWIIRAFTAQKQQVQPHKSFDKQDFSSILFSKEISWREG